MDTIFARSSQLLQNRHYTHNQFSRTRCRVLCRVAALPRSRGARVLVFGCPGDVWEGGATFAAAISYPLNCTVALQGINFERSRYQLALHLSAKIVLDRIHDLRTAHQQAVLVVVELRIGGPERRLSFHVTAVDCVKELLVELRDGFKELV